MHDGDVAGEGLKQASPSPGRSRRAAVTSGAAGGVRALLRSQSRNIGLLVALLAALAFVSVQRHDYLSIANFRVIGLEMAYTMIAAVGTTFLMIGGNIDLSIGSNLGLSAIVAALLVNHVGPIGAFTLAILLSGAIGLANGVLVWRVKLSPLIITLGSLTVIHGAVLVLSHGYAIFNLRPSFSNLGSATPLGIPSALAIAIVLIPIAFVILGRTTFGQYTYAIGGNRQASAATGLNVRTLVLATFALNGLLIGLTGVLEASRFGSADPTFGVGFELDVITAVILGGVAFTGGEGGIGGTVLAVMLLGVIESSLVWLRVDPFYSDVVKGSVLIIAVTLDQIATEQRERYQKMVAMRERQSLLAET